MCIVWQGNFPEETIKFRRNCMVPIKEKNKIKRKSALKMKEFIKKINETLKELLIGILFYGIIVEVIGICFIKDRVYFSIGLWFGIVMALAAAIHMWWGLDRALTLGDAAGKYALSQNMIRYGVIVVAFGALCVMDFGNPMAAFAGIMGLKAGAYLQPFTHKIMKKIQRR